MDHVIGEIFYYIKKLKKEELNKEQKAKIKVAIKELNMIVGIDWEKYMFWN